MSYDVTFPSDPEKSGSGLWFIIHTTGKEANTEEKKKNFVSLIDSIAHNHPCGNCRSHMNEYLQRHPIKNFWVVYDESGKDIGIFLWTFIFHNAVNSRIGKPQMDFQTAYNMYANDDIKPCTAQCGQKTEVENKGLKFSRRKW